MIDLERLTVDYGSGRPAVDSLDLHVDAGEWVGVVGPNGAGKTSVLRAICGLTPFTGSVRVGGAELASLSSRERARRIALVPQMPVVPSTTAVVDYVLLGRTPYVPFLGSETRADREAAAASLDDLGLTALAGRPLGSLSGGELQRAVLARALAQRAPVLLLDEPTTWLDVGHQQQVLELVDALRLRDGITVLSVMHDLTVASLFVEHLVLLSAGRAVASGTAAEVLTEDTIREHFGAAVRVSSDGSGHVAVHPRRRDAGVDAPPAERPRRDVPRARATSVVVVNTGEGKGKTTAAVGIAVRAVARGWRVCVIQFLKSGRWRSGEQSTGTQLGMTWHALGDGFTWDSSDMEATRRLSVDAWQRARDAILGGEFELVVLDEVTYPMTWGWISTRDVVGTLAGRPPHVNVVLTGRDAPADLVDAADTVTEMRNVRHAYEKGVDAIRGIDF